MDQPEKMGAILRKETQMTQFKEALEDCQLSDLGFKGSKFTWTNYRQDGSFIKECLDRAIANLGWCILNKRVEVNILAARSSNHKPMFITFSDREGDYT